MFDEETFWTTKCFLVWKKLARKLCALRKYSLRFAHLHSVTLRRSYTTKCPPYERRHFPSTTTKLHKFSLLSTFFISMARFTIWYSLWMSTKNAAKDEQNLKKRTIFREKKSMSQSLSNSYKTLSPQNIQMQRHFCVCVYNLYCSFTLADSCFVFVDKKLSKCYYIVERMLLMIKSTIRQTRNEHFNRFCESESIEQRNLAKNIKLWWFLTERNEHKSKLPHNREAWHCAYKRTRNAC